MLSVLSTPWQKPTHCHSATIHAVRRVTWGRDSVLAPSSGSCPDPPTRVHPSPPRNQLCFAEWLSLWYFWAVCPDVLSPPPPQRGNTVCQGFSSPLTAPTLLHAPKTWLLPKLEKSGNPRLRPSRDPKEAGKGQLTEGPHLPQGQATVHPGATTTLPA